MYSGVVRLRGDWVVYINSTVGLLDNKHDDEVDTRLWRHDW